MRQRDIKRLRSAYSDLMVGATQMPNSNDAMRLCQWALAVFLKATSLHRQGSVDGVELHRIAALPYRMDLGKAYRSESAALLSQDLDFVRDTIANLAAKTQASGRWNRGRHYAVLRALRAKQLCLENSVGFVDAEHFPASVFFAIGLDAETSCTVSKGSILRLT